MEDAFSYSEEVEINNLNIDFGGSIVFVVVLVLLFVCFAIARRIIRKNHEKNSYIEHSIFLVRLPKDKNTTQDGNQRVQDLHEEIAVGETLFASVGGLRAQRGFKHWLFGRDDHFSFEIVANQKKIAFYAVCPKSSARYLEQQIHAHYPEASVDEVSDYNIFHPHNVVSAGTIQARREFIFPFKTYKHMETDPMNSIVNVMSKLEHDEGMAIQIIVRSAKAEWHKRIRKVVTKVSQTNSVKEAIREDNIISKLLGLFSEMWLLMNPEQKNKNNDTPPKSLSAMEQEMLKTMEEKNSKAGLDVNIRIVVSAANIGKSQSALDNIASAFSEYNNYEYGNNFSNAKQSNQNHVINDFIYRRFRKAVSTVLNTEELASIYHFPLSGTETPNIVWLTAKNAAAPSNIPDEGLLLGNNIYRNINREVRLKREDRKRHSYIIGKSGVGKSVLLTNMAVQDAMNGEGFCVLDPHGDLIQDILERIPPERAEDVIIFSPADLERPMGLNLLEFDPAYPEQKSFVINEMIGILDKLYDLKSTGGPMFEQYMRNAMLLTMDDVASGSTLMEIPKVLADPDFRKMKLSRCKNQTVVDFWVKEAEKAGGDAALANIVPYITSKLTPFISNDMMRPIIAQQKSAFNIRKLMDEGKILLVDLPKGIIGETNAYLLGMIIVGKILMSALSRADQSGKDRKDFYLYIDEFQNFTTNSVCQILSEARKYGLGLIIAHQYIGQLSKAGDTQIKDAVFGNVGTMVSFKVGADDAEYLTKDFGPVFNQFDLVNVGKGMAYVKLLVDNEATRPFSMHTIWPRLGRVYEGVDKKIRALSRLKFGQDRNIIEAEIKRRSRVAMTTDK